MKTLKLIFVPFLLLLISVSAMAQITNPVTFNVSRRQVSATEIEVVFAGKIAPGWHLYAPGLGDAGPISASLTTEKAEGAKAVGGLKAIGKEISQYDEMFQTKVRYYENSVTFVQRYALTGDSYHVKGYLEYGACSNVCTPPTDVDFDFSGKVDASAVSTDNNKAEDKTGEDVADASVKEGEAEALADTSSVSMPMGGTVMASDSLLWQPVISELSALNGGSTTEGRSWTYILLLGFLGGLLALFTPCVWPIIPMTVSFFLKRSKDRKKGIRDAITYGIAVIVIYLTLGLAVTAIFGASSLNALATNAVVNIVFCLLLVVFALSFFGWFEITLPSSWSNAIDSKASATSGLISIFLMAFTLALVSFSCTGPIIGFLLVEVSTTGNLLAPALGMLGFAVALALPFTLFALFPAWLKQAPKSGSWMNIIKVTLGFIELAFALKFFSVADLAYGWHLLDREVFLCLWIIIFATLGLYLLGIVRFRTDMDGGEPRAVPCITLGMISLAFALYMVPGLWGAPCKAVSAFAPPISTQDFNLYNNTVEARFKTYEEGMQAAASEGKPVLVDFTGFGCVNCRKMEASVWTDARVADILKKDVVLISLYVDDKTPLPEKVEVVENGQKRTLRTVGDKWSYLQRSKFGANAQPFYVMLSPDGKPLTGSYSFDEDVSHYLEFLEKGLKK